MISHQRFQQPLRSVERDKAVSAGPYVQPDPFRKAGLPALKASYASVSFIEISKDKDKPKGRVERLDVTPAELKSSTRVLFVHGLWLGKAEEYLPLMENLAHLGIASSIFCQLGHGNSDYSNKRRINFTLKDQMESISAVLDDLKRQGVSAVHIVGHSYGGYLVQKFMLENKHEMVQSASLIANVSPRGNFMANVRFFLSHPLAALKSYLTADAGAAVRNPKVCNQALFNGLMPEGFVPGPASLLGNIQAMQPVGHIENIGRPVQVIAAADDRIISLKESQDTAERVGAKLEIVTAESGKAHHMGLTQAATAGQYAYLLSEFMMKQKVH